MMPPSTPASILYAAWLLLTGALFGWAVRAYVGRRREPTVPARPSTLTEVQIHVFGQTVQTDMTVNLANLETLANGIGYTLTPMPTRTLQ